MSIIRSIVTMFQFRVDGNKLASVEQQVGQTAVKAQVATKSVQALGESFRWLGSTIAVAAAAIAGSRIFKMLTTDFANQADQVAKVAPGLGLTANEYLGLGYAAQKSGLQIENVSTAMAKLGRKITEAAQGNKETKKVFKDLGIDIKDASGRLKTPMATLLELSDAIRAVEDPSKRQFYLMKFFEESGPKYVDFMNQGAAGIRAMMAEAEKYGLTLDKKAIASAVAWKDATLKLRTAFLGLRNALASRILPVLNKWIEGILKWWREGDNAARVTKYLTWAFKLAALALAGFITYKAIKVLYAFRLTLIKTLVAVKEVGLAMYWAQIKTALWLAGLLALYLLIDDLYVFARGGKSLIGEWLGDSDTATSLRKALLDLGAALKKMWADLAPVLAVLWAELRRALPEIWKAIQPVLPILTDMVVWAIKAAAQIATLLAQAISWGSRAKQELGEFYNILMWILNPIGKIIDKIREAATSTKLWGKLSRVLGPIWDELKNLASKAFDGIVDGIKSLVKRGLKFIEPLLAPIRWLAREVKSMFGGNVGSFGVDLLKGFEPTVSKAGAVATLPFVPAVPIPGAIGPAALAGMLAGGAGGRGSVDASKTANVGTINVTVAGTTNMTPEQLKTTVREATAEALTDQFFGLFSDIKEPG